MTTIQIKKEIINNLKGLKISLGVKTYNDVLEELIRLSYVKENTGGISNKDLLENLGKGQKALTRRLEALHTRIGYFEKDYFLKIIDIVDAVEKANVDKKHGIDHSKIPDSTVEKTTASADLQLRKQFEDLEESHLEMENINERLNKKINTLRNKIVKKSGVFASGYELSLTDEEYNLLFG